MKRYVLTFSLFFVNDFCPLASFSFLTKNFLGPKTDSQIAKENADKKNEKLNSLKIFIQQFKNEYSFSSEIEEEYFSCLKKLRNEKREICNQFREIYIKIASFYDSIESLIKMENVKPIEENSILLKEDIEKLIFNLSFYKSKSNKDQNFSDKRVANLYAVIDNLNQINEFINKLN